MEELVKYFESLEARIAGLETRIAALEAEKQAKDVRIAALEEELKKHQTVLAALNEDIEELKNRPYVELEDEFDEEELEPAEPVEEEEDSEVSVPDSEVSIQHSEEPEVIEPVAESVKEESQPEPVVEEPVKEEPAVEPEPGASPQSNGESGLRIEGQTEEKVEEPAEEKPAPAASKAVLYGKPVDDIRLAISIGDRFLYQRELFGQNAELMQRSLIELNELHSFDEAIAYISSHFQWDTESNTYQQFLVTLHRRFG